MECPVCYFAFENQEGKIPKSVPCGHTMCENCIKQINKNGITKCPFCKKEYESQSPNDFPTNFQLLNMIEQMRDQQQKPTIQPRKKQQRVQFQDSSDSQEEEIKTQFEGICVQHQEKKYEFYCKQCKLFLCKKCLPSHKNHDLILLEEIQEKIQTTSQKNSQDIETLQRNLKQLKAQFDFLQRDFQQHNLEEIQHAEQQFTQIQHKLTEKKEQLFNQFYENVQDQETQIKTQISKFNDYITSIQKQSQKILDLQHQANTLSLDSLYKKGFQYFDQTQSIQNIQKKIQNCLGYSIENVDPIIDKIQEEKSNQFMESGTSILFDLQIMDNSISDFSQVKKNKEIHEELKLLKTKDLEEESLNINQSTMFTEQPSASLFQSQNQNQNQNQDQNNINNIAFPTPQNNQQQLTSFENINQILKKSDKTYSPNKALKNISSNSDFINNPSNTIIQEQQQQQYSNIFGSNQNSSNTYSNTNTNLNNNNNSNQISTSSQSTSKQNCATPNQLRNFDSPRPQNFFQKQSTFSFSNKVCLLQGKQIYTFDVITKQWEQKSLEFQFEEQSRTTKNFQLKLHGASVYLSNNKIFYNGGGPTNQSYILEFQDEKIKVIQCPPMKYKRMWHSVFYIRPHAYIIGGYDGSQRLNTCEKIDLSRKTDFQEIAPMNENRSLFGSCIHKGNIYVFGGLEGRLSQTSNTIEKYDTFKGTWELMKVQLPKKISGLSAIPIQNNDKILLFGGQCDRKKQLKSIYEFDPETQKLRQKIQQMKEKRQMNNKVFIQGKEIYLLGGNFNFNYEIFDCEKNSSIYEPEKQSYKDVIKNDLTNFTMFTTFNNHYNYL